MRFIDLFAGLGGFHIALSRLGHTCVFSCEIDETLRSLYLKNFGVQPVGDIRSVNEHQVPSHDILCAGFPCQPFSKAGDQKGFDCAKWGDLFSHVMRIVKHHHPKYVLLENVPNLPRHNNGDTWSLMKEQLREAGYDVDAETLSPHRFGIPQIRERVFIAATYGTLNGFKWPKEIKKSLDIKTVLTEKPRDARKLSDQVVRCLEAWQEFIQAFPKDAELPTFPIWSMEFGATYPYKDKTPRASKRLGRYKGSHGIPLNIFPVEKRFEGLPSHARGDEKIFPEWKIEFIKKNRELYQRHKTWIDKWMPKILPFPSSLQKLEWNCKGQERDIWKYVIQFRASGVRVKRPTTAPALVAMTVTQVPIIAWERRYMTPRECARLQSFLGRELKCLPKSPTKAYESLGNSVNADIVELVAKSLIGNHSSASKTVHKEAVLA